MKKINVVLTLAILMGLLSSPLTVAQGPPPDPVQPPFSPFCYPEEAQPDRPQLACWSAGPDEFGYTYTEVALDWLDATPGTDTGIDSDERNVVVLDLPFPFRYYEYTYQKGVIALISLPLT